MSLISGGSDIDWDGLERMLGVEFEDKTLLHQALRHRSALNEQPDRDLRSYERLEYLGDSVLGFLVAKELYLRYPEMEEGDLTQARASLVRNTTLAKIASDLNIGAYLILGRGEEASGGRTRTRNLGGALEAILGAVFLERGETRAAGLVRRWLGPHLEAIGQTGTQKNTKGALQELAHRRGFSTPKYQVVETPTPDGPKSFTVEVSIDGELLGLGIGTRRVDAELDAAGKALSRLPKA